MKSRSGLALAIAAFALSLAIPFGDVASEVPSADGPDIRIELRDGLLAAEIDDAPLPRVLEEIGKLVGFKVVRVADFDDFPRVTSKFENLAVEAAVERLLGNANRILFYSESEGAESQRVLSQLWLLGPGEAGAYGTQSVELIDELQHEEPVKRSQAALRLVRQPDARPVLENLALMLQTDPEPLVRSRVAIALGSLGDDRAVANLEKAVLDENFSVRAQSITALGQIGGERATTILGSILANDRIRPVERVIAAQALWKQDSEVAMSYLEASRNDANEQVRDAASMPPAVYTGSSESGSVVAE